MIGKWPCVRHPCMIHHHHHLPSEKTENITPYLYHIIQKSSQSCVMREQHQHQQHHQQQHQQNSVGACTILYYYYYYYIRVVVCVKSNIPVPLASSSLSVLRFTWRQPFHSIQQHHHPPPLFAMLAPLAGRHQHQYKTHRTYNGIQPAKNVVCIFYDCVVCM